MILDNYTIEEHLHRYACWTAARAASISRFKNSEIVSCFEKVSLREKVQSLRHEYNLNHNDYLQWFISMCDKIMVALNEIETKEKGRRISFGIAAKLVSIYIKTVEVLPTKGASRLSNIAFPPIDSILLNNLKKKSNLEITSVNWSKMEKGYFIDLINQLKAFIGDLPFWKLELYWKV
jgi:hypothetical protein